MSGQDLEQLRSEGNLTGTEQIRRQRQQQSGLSVSLKENPLSIIYLLLLAEPFYRIQQADGRNGPTQMVMLCRPQQTFAVNGLGEIPIDRISTQINVGIGKIARIPGLF